MGRTAFNVAVCWPTSDPASTAATNAGWPPGADDINCQKLYRHCPPKDQAAPSQQFTSAHNVKPEQLEFSTVRTVVASVAKLAWAGSVPTAMKPSHTRSSTRPKDYKSRCVTFALRQPGCKWASPIKIDKRQNKGRWKRLTTKSNKAPI